MTEPQKQSFLTAVRALKNRQFNGPDNSDPATWNLDKFVRVHWDYQLDTHNKPAFFPWHRWYINGFEKALQSINPNVFLPYWDWTLDSQNPAASDMFARNAFGGNGDPTRGNCVTDGIFASDWSMNDSTGNRPCLKRCSTWGALYSPNGIASLLSHGTDYESFREGMEGGPHASVHNQLGGSCGDVATMASPFDPVFFLHHAMVDKLWWKWQVSCNEFQNDYGAGLNDPMSPFAAPVSQAMSTTSGRLCYSYSLTAGDVAFTLQCPSGQKPIGGGSVTSTTSRATGTATSSTTAPTPTLIDRSQNRWLQSLVISMVPNGASFAALQFDDEISVSSKVGRFSSLSKRESTQFNGSFIPPPPTEDRTDLLNIRYPSEIPAGWLKMMGYDVEKVRTGEAIARLAVDEVNNNPDYTSPAALKHFNDYNRLGLWQP